MQLQKELAGRWIRNVMWSFLPLGSYFSLEASFAVTGRCCHVIASFWTA